jgi:hypothetical protein
MSPYAAPRAARAGTAAGGPLEIASFLERRAAPGLRRQRIASLVGLVLFLPAFGLLLSMIGLFAIGEVGTGMTTADWIASAALIALFGGVTTALFLTLVRTARATAPAWLVLERRPNSIVWLHLETVRGGLGAILANAFVGRIILRTDEDRSIVLVVRGRDREAAFAELAALLPQASSGWSPKLDARFRAAPSTLRR